MDKQSRPLFIWGVITHPCLNLSGNLTKLSLKLRHGWIITFFVLCEITHAVLSSAWQLAVSLACCYCCSRRLWKSLYSHYLPLGSLRFSGGGWAPPIELFPLNVSKHPVGHNYCKNCLDHRWYIVYVNQKWPSLVQKWFLLPKYSLIFPDALFAPVPMLWRKTSGVSTDV